MDMSILIPHATTSGLLLAMGMTPCVTLAQNDCSVPDWEPDAWRSQYATAVAETETLHENLQPDPFFTELRTIPDHESVTIMQWNEDGTAQSPHTIENPVLLISWVGSPLAGGNSVEHVAWQAFKPLQRYTCNPIDDAGGNIWFTLNGDMRAFLASRFPEQANCVDPRIGEQCQNAIALGIPTVGLPYGFSDPSGPDPILPWWSEFLVLAVADRDALIRPSLNPTVRPDSRTHPTDSGRPVWDAAESAYRFAEKETEPELYAAQVHAARNFVGYNMNVSPPEVFRGWEDFETAVNLWGEASWNAPDPWFRFPYTQLGRTWYWQSDGLDGTPEGQPALSEFLLMGEQPIWVIGTWQGGGYLFENPEEEEGVAPWCERCPGDLNIDGRVDGADLGLLLSHWGSADNPCMNLTKNDPVVGSDDLGFLLTCWTGPQGCPGWPESLSPLKPSDQPCP